MNCAGEIEIFHDTTCAGRFCLDTFRPPLADDPLPPHTGSEFLPVRLLMPLPAGRSCVASVFASAKLLSGERAGRLGLTACSERAAPLTSLRSDSLLFGLRRALRALAAPLGAPPLGLPTLKGGACTLLPAGSLISPGGVVELDMCGLSALSGVFVCAPIPPRFWRLVCAISRT
jgi:hypothetical protein